MLDRDGSWIEVAFFAVVGLGLAASRCASAVRPRSCAGWRWGAGASMLVLAGLLVLQRTVVYTTF